LPRIEPRWLPFEQLAEINKDEVLVTKERHYLRDPGLLESAWNKPRNRWHYGETDMICLVVSLLHGIARNHCFEEGNKRTAETAALMFLGLNGYLWTMPDNQKLGQQVVALVNHEIDESDLVDWMRDFVEPI